MTMGPEYKRIKMAAPGIWEVIGTFEKTSGGCGASDRNVGTWFSIRWPRCSEALAGEAGAGPRTWYSTRGHPSILGHYAI